MLYIANVTPWVLAIVFKVIPPWAFKINSNCAVRGAQEFKPGIECSFPLGGPVFFFNDDPIKTAGKFNVPHETSSFAKSRNASVLLSSAF